MAQQIDQTGPEAVGSPAPPASVVSIRLLWQQKRLVALGIVIGVALGALYYVQAPPVYQATAQVLVVKKGQELPVAMPGSEPRMAYAEDYLSTHQVLIRSPLIIAKAIKKKNLQNLKSIADLPDPVAAIIESLQVSREMKETHPTNILNISFRGPVPGDCVIVVNAVIDAYREFLEGTYKNVSDETAKLITQARNVLEKKLSKTEQEHRKFKLNHPLLWKGKDGINVLQDRIFGIEAKRSALLVRKAEIETRLTTFERAIKAKYSREELLAMVSDSASRLAGEMGKTSPTEDPLAVLELQEKSLLDDFGPDHPKVKSIREKIKFLRSRYKLLGRQQNQKVLDPLEAHLASLKSELEHTKIGIEALTKLLLNEQLDAKEMVRFENQDDFYRTETTRNQQLFDSVSKRLQEVNLLKDFGGYEAQSISTAERGKKVGPRAIPVFAVAGFLGLLVGFGLAVLAEKSNHSFRTPDEIRRQLGLPVVGHIPFFVRKEDEANQATGADGQPLNSALVAAHRPKSRESESYRGVRTSLYFSTRGEGHKVIQVTSPDMGDGKSTLAANLAVSIAQSGKRIILIDADFRRPRLHKLFGVSASQGLASVINGEAELNDVIQPSGIAGLSVSPCGPIPDNPAELLTQPRFKELLNYIREQYDFVIIDTPPLLVVTDPCVVVPHVDAVLLIVRISKNVRPHAVRAKEVLETLGANVLGVVVNGVDRDNSGYGYDTYRYGYSYKSYAYNYEQSDGYYSESETPGTEGTPVNGATKTPRSRKKKSKGFLGWLFNRT